MNVALILRILGVLLMLFSLTLLVPLMVSAFSEDAATHAFVVAYLITLGSGGLLYWPARNERREFRTRDGFLITALFWIVLGLFGALPFFLADQPKLDLADAIFESMSGLTTTGATVISGIDRLPLSVLYYRQQLQWLGGIGIIVIAVAILPMLGIGGMQMYRAETPGPVKETKMTPRITGTAKVLFLIYVALTLSCALAYWLAGMSGFDALAHSFSTVAIGGFSTHDQSLGYFKSSAVMVVAMLFMVLSAINFALHFVTWRQRHLKHYLSDPECAFFLGMLCFTTFVTCTVLVVSGHYPANAALLHGAFQAVSMATTTGFATTDFSAWPAGLPILLILFAFMGGCAGSTAGGIKAIRVLLINKQGMRELRQLVHPNAMIPVKLGKRSVPDRVIGAVWSFFAMYIVVFSIGLLILLVHGLDFETAFSAIAAMQNNLGPGLGEVSVNYGGLSSSAKLVLCLSMLFGRLEIFTLLVLFTPAFWRR